MLLPLPRFRINTEPTMYLAILKDIVLGKTKVGDADRVLEEKIKSRTNSPYAICMPQNRVGIFLAVKALIEPGQKVILSPYTIPDVINMVICAGGIPVFADIERKTCNINPTEIEKLIDEKTRVVLVTHFHGYVCEMDRIVQICKQRGILLLEDAAQAFGASYRSRSVGTFGEAGIFSLGTYKNVNAFSGGMLLTPDKYLHDRLRGEIESFPFQEVNHYLLRVLDGLITDVATYPPLFRLLTFRIIRFGYLHNLKFIINRTMFDVDNEAKNVTPQSYLRRMMPMQAKLALPQIDNVDQKNDIRINFAKLYYEGLKDVEHLTITPFDGSHKHNIYTTYIIQAPERDVLVKWLIQRGCDVAIGHHKNCADLPAFKEFYRDCPNARATANSSILLPTYPKYSEKHVKKNIEVIKDFFSSNKNKTK